MRNWGCTASGGAEGGCLASRPDLAHLGAGAVGAGGVAHLGDAMVHGVCQGRGWAQAELSWMLAERSPHPGASSTTQALLARTAQVRMDDPCWAIFAFNLQPEKNGPACRSSGSRRGCSHGHRREEPLAEVGQRPSLVQCSLMVESYSRPISCCTWRVPGELMRKGSRMPTCGGRAGRACVGQCMRRTALCRPTAWSRRRPGKFDMPEEATNTLGPMRA